MAKEKVIRLRVSQQEYDMIHALADSDKRSVSDVIRLAVFPPMIVNALPKSMNQAPGGVTFCDDIHPVKPSKVQKPFASRLKGEWEPK